MKKPYELFTSQDGLWRARFAPKIAKELGPISAYCIAAPSKETAKKIAGILVSDVLLKLKTSRG